MEQAPEKLEQWVLHKLENGDYLRVVHTPLSDIVTILLGGPDPEEPAQFLWTWRLDLTAQGLAEINTDLSYVLTLLSRVNAANAEQVIARLASLDK